MSEQLDLSAPIVPPSITSYRVTVLHLDWNAPSVKVGLTGSDGSAPIFSYAGNEASALMTVLNTANLSTTSLQKRVLQKLTTDGKLPAGSVTGTPA